MQLAFCINKTGQTQPIFDLDSGGKKVGELYNREAFIFYGGEGELASICFLGPDGKETNAMVRIDNIPCFENPVTCSDYPYGHATIKGKEYLTFIMRRTMNIYKSNGDYWGKVAANMLVATSINAIVGVNHPNWIEIKYVQKSPTREWIQVDAEGAGYGFVDTGIFTASSYSKIPFYGSW